MFGSETVHSGYQTVEINWGAQLLDPLKMLFVNIVSFIPELIAAAGVVLIGWLIAILIMKLVRKFLEAIRFDRVAQTTGICEILDEEKIGMSPSCWISRLFYWFGIFIAWMTALGTLHLRVPVLILEGIGGFLSMIFTGLIIFLLGLFLSMIASKCVESTSRKLNAGNPVLQAGVVRWAVILMTFAAALAHFGFPRDLVFIALAAVGATLCVTFAIAFGFGGIQSVPKILDKMFD